MVYDENVMWVVDIPGDRVTPTDFCPMEIHRSEPSTGDDSAHEGPGGGQFGVWRVLWTVIPCPCPHCVRLTVEAKQVVGSEEVEGGVKIG